MESMARKYYRSARAGRTGLLVVATFATSAAATPIRLIGPLLGAVRRAALSAHLVVMLPLRSRDGCEALHALVGCWIRTDGRKLAPRGRADQEPCHPYTYKHLVSVDLHNALGRRDQVEAVDAAARVTSEVRAGRAISPGYLARHDVQRWRLAAGGRRGGVAGHLG